MSFDYFVHATKDADGGEHIPGVEPVRDFTNPAYALHYAQTLSMAYPESFITVQVEYRRD